MLFITKNWSFFLVFLFAYCKQLYKLSLCKFILFWAILTEVDFYLNKYGVLCDLVHLSISISSRHIAMAMLTFGKSWHSHSFLKGVGAINCIFPIWNLWIGYASLSDIHFTIISIIILLFNNIYVSLETFVKLV